VVLPYNASRASVRCISLRLSLLLQSNLPQHYEQREKDRGEMARGVAKGIGSEIVPAASSAF
jgi:hypothetical protein